MRGRPLSSIPDRSDRGQALAIFAISLTTVVLAAALAFDAGLMFVERRDQQNAADAAAIAGARYLTEQSGAAKIDAESAARVIADANGFLDGDNDIVVDVNIPPIHGDFRGLNGYIEVEIFNERDSIFAGIMGVLDWDVSARAVARNSESIGDDFTIIALDPEGCNALKVTGSGDVVSHGDIQVDSKCTDGAMVAGGTGVIKVEAGVCSVVGEPPNSIKANGGGTIECTKNVPAMEEGDPLSAVAPPAYEDQLLPDPVERLDGSLEDHKKGIPSGCPGGSAAATQDAPKECAFQNAAYVGTTWLLHPGLYPGGLDLSTGTFHLSPGIYYIAGGGFSAGGKDATVLTSDDGGNIWPEGSDPRAKRGVMIYNSVNDAPHPFVDWKPISLNGGYADFQMLPNLWPEGHPNERFNNIIIWNDRDYPEDNLSLIHI